MTNPSLVYSFLRHHLSEDSPEIQEWHELNAKLEAAKLWMSAFPPNSVGELSRRMTEDRARAELVMGLEPLAAEWEKHHIDTEEMLEAAERKHSEVCALLKNIQNNLRKVLRERDTARAVALKAIERIDVDNLTTQALYRDLKERLATKGDKDG